MAIVETLAILVPFASLHDCEASVDQAVMQYNPKFSVELSFYSGKSFSSGHPVVHDDPLILVAEDTAPETGHGLIVPAVCVSFISTSVKTLQAQLWMVDLPSSRAYL
ncbi:uncharacterized protein UV8b_02568 [Ustilaginoidea virens]|uniref:Uncharacterized protein n=1 Tax=Ustilaginoidea virens TaxID=1159556 RepID=A0A8E5HN24_USTVR|nr:uncharacterized protein UV8b_02568 [Ustilaginoidea virens]QUC18327.1 hypothetical protein UV8b_02568 [Ustilaginoidea virens]